MDSEVFDAIFKTNSYCILGHPRFFNQLFGGLDQYSLGGAWLTETLNTSQ